MATGYFLFRIILGCDRNIAESAEREKVKVMLHTQVQSLLMESSGEDAPENIVTGVKLTDGTTMPADAVIIATGGFSYQTTGSTGDGYRFAKEAGHTVTDIRPSLVPFLAKKTMSGRCRDFH